MQLNNYLIASVTLICIMNGLSDVLFNKISDCYIRVNQIQQRYDDCIKVYILYSKKTLAVKNLVNDRNSPSFCQF